MCIRDRVTTAQRESLLKTKKNQQQLSCPVAYDVADIGITVISTFPARLMESATEMLTCIQSKALHFK